jgi:Transglutaminase-like superfamily
VSNWRKFWRLPADEKSLFLTALILLPAVRLGLFTLGLRRVRAALSLGRSGNCDSAGLDEMQLRGARRAARLVAVAAQFAGGTCLPRAIVLSYFLDRRGIRAELRIGVRKDERGIEAHAWVEAGGLILNDDRDVVERYAAFDQDFVLARGNWR